ncbi:hypothetical protein [Xenorhabdus entomophaga]|uniref:hypothetical protein n=1 Tax=Xenorhabdus entomophaga TaxID=3136257 RepID=UPI0030F410F0
MKKYYPAVIQPSYNEEFSHTSIDKVNFDASQFNMPTLNGDNKTILSSYYKDNYLYNFRFNFYPLPENDYFTANILKPKFYSDYFEQWDGIYLTDTQSYYMHQSTYIPSEYLKPNKNGHFIYTEDILKTIPNIKKTLPYKDIMYSLYYNALYFDEYENMIFVGSPRIIQLTYPFKEPLEVPVTHMFSGVPHKAQYFTNDHETTSGIYLDYLLQLTIQI